MTNDVLKTLAHFDAIKLKRENIKRKNYEISRRRRPDGGDKKR